MDDAAITCFWISVVGLILAALTPVACKIIYNCSWEGVKIWCQYGYKWLMVGFVAIGLLASVLSNIFATVDLCLEHWEISLAVEVFVYFIISILITIIFVVALVFLILW